MKTNNELLAEFMGLVESTIPNRYWTEKSLEGFGMGKLKELNYDTDWNWLMQVVEKIEGLSYCVEIKSDTTIIYEYGSKTSNINNDEGTKIENTYYACVEFVKLYNEQKK